MCRDRAGTQLMPPAWACNLSAEQLQPSGRLYPAGNVIQEDRAQANDDLASCPTGADGRTKVLLAAPTDRQQRLRATGAKATTIHRLLEYGINEETGRLMFRRNARNL